MTIYSIKKWSVCPLLLLTISALSQENFTTFWQPQVGVYYQVVNDYTHNFFFISRNVLAEDSNFKLDLRQFDIVHFSKLKIRYNQSISLGLRWRNSKIFDSDQINEFRLTQQYNIKIKPNKVRYGHRMRTEQRIFDGFTLHRFRYRLAVDFPLEGERLNVGQAFSVFSAEQLFTVANKTDPLYTLRIRAGLGVLLSPKSTLQFILQYRLIDYTKEANHAIFLETVLNLGL